MRSAPGTEPPRTARPRQAWADNLKVCLVVGVIVAHATMAWTGVGNWVLREQPIREPLYSLVTAASVLGAMFGMALFFLLAGLFTPGSVRRKGPGRFAADRCVRLGVPMVFFALLISPVVEFVDPDNAGWNRGFIAFTVHVWWPPVPGPTWFLGVLLLFSLAYATAIAVVRAGRPPRAAGEVGSDHDRTRTAADLWPLVVFAVMIGVASFLVRLWIPLGAERWHLALGQAPAWAGGFCLGVLAEQRGWLDGPTPQSWRRLPLAAWTAAAAILLITGTAIAAGVPAEEFGGGWDWRPLLVAVVEGVLVVTMSLWLIDLFQRRFDHSGRMARMASRAAFAAFVIHQLVLVGAVLATRLVPWPPEVEYVLAATVAVLVSFSVGLLLVRLPGVSRVV